MAAASGGGWPLSLRAPQVTALASLLFWWRGQLEVSTPQPTSPQSERGHGSRTERGRHATPPHAGQQLPLASSLALLCASLVYILSRSWLVCNGHAPTRMAVMRVGGCGAGHSAGGGRYCVCGKGGVLMAHSVPPWHILGGRGGTHSDGPASQAHQRRDTLWPMRAALQSPRSFVRPPSRVCVQESMQRDWRTRCLPFPGSANPNRDCQAGGLAAKQGPHTVQLGCARGQGR